ncbi:antA/AntB antirepressor family protein [Campylobacter majalis]|uniref:antA/AntB antirepressor family protein n=1 Tax=Campylobacter majalis TaxID=2790656 RepID=UPI003D6845A3
MELELTFPTTELQGAFPANTQKLFKFLSPDTRHNDWIIRRISQYGFTLNQDYIIQTTYTGRRPRKEYFITLDMAKELCMVENNERGKEARQYFIKCEKELQALKFKHYVDEISSLNAILINKANRHQRQINGYKSQIKQHNNQIVILKHELAKYEKAHECEIIDENSPKFKPFSKDHLSYKELWREYIDVMRNNNALKIFIEQYRREVAELKEKLADNTKLIQHLAKAQAKLDEAYRTIGAVMSYADGDKYFLENSTKVV